MKASAKRTVIARICHTCIECSRTIEEGEKTTLCDIYFKGKIRQYICADCQSAIDAITSPNILPIYADDFGALWYLIADRLRSIKSFMPEKAKFWSMTEAAQNKFFEIMDTTNSWGYDVE